jgi:hypothetical protein
VASIIFANFLTWRCKFIFANSLPPLLASRPTRAVDFLHLHCTSVFTSLL